MKHGARAGGQSAAIFVLAVATRLLVFLAAGWSGRVLNNDGTSYGQIAQSVLAGQGFAFAAGDPTAFRPFGYPLLLAAVFALAGPSVLAVQVAQAIASGLVAVITFSLARRLIDGRVALLAGIGLALHPVLVTISGLLAPEAAALLAEMGLLWFALGIAWAQPPRWVCAAGGSLCAAAAILLRPELLLVVVLLPVAYLLHTRHLTPPARLLIVSTVLGVLLAVLPVAARNAARFDAFIPFPTIGGVTFWGANNAVVDGGWVLPSPDNWPGADPPTSMRGWPDLTEQQSQARFYKASLGWIREHPGDAAALIPRKLARSWTLSYADESKSAALPPIVKLANALFGALAVAGIIVVARRYRTALWLLLTPVAAWLVKTVVFYGSARQTATALPVLIIFSAAALIALVDLAARQIAGPAAPSAV